MNVITALCTTGFTALLAVGAVTVVGDDAFATIASQGEAASLASETSMLAQAIGTEAEIPMSLTCVPDAATGKACAALAEYTDFKPTGDFVYSLQHTATGGFVLYGATPDGSQRVAFDSEGGGITDLSDTSLNAESATALEQTG